MSSINLYPQIDDVFLETVIIKNKRSYHYNGLDGNEYIVEEKTLKGFEDKEIFELEDDNSEYDQSTDTLFMDFELSIKNGRYLFGETGYVYDDAVIGVGLEWKSKKSKIRHCRMLGSFSKEQLLDENVFKIENIKLNELNSDTTFSWVMFVKKAGTINNGNNLVNKEGLIIGRKPLWTIKGEGDGSLFPIIEYISSKDPLWTVKTSIEDPYNDSFTVDNVCILINKFHPDYQFIQSVNRYFNPSFLKEVLSNALYILIKEIIANIDDFNDIKSKHCESGSVVQALLYFEQELGFKIHDNDIELLKSIKLFLDKNMIF